MTHRFVSRRHSLGLIARALGGVAAATAFCAVARGATSASADQDAETPSAEPPTTATEAHRVALFAPPASGVYKRAALALIEGVRAGQSRAGSGVSVEIIEVDEAGNELRALCETLAGRGFHLAIGPLTRNAVTALAVTGPLPLPVLALNQTEGVPPPPNMILFGLAIENEAAQAASYAYRDASAMQTARRPRAAIVHDGAPVSQRSVTAFIERWYQSGGEYYEAVQTESASVAELRELLRGVDADVCFVALPRAGVAALRSALGDGVTLYGTSLLNAGALPSSAGPGPQQATVIRTPELDGVRIVAMPWQVQPDHPAVMIYPRQPELNAELQKLYALGIDAFRLGLILLAGQTRADLDGVTGLLHMDLAQTARVDRLPLLAEYRDGLLGLAQPR